MDRYEKVCLCIILWVRENKKGEPKQPSRQAVSAWSMEWRIFPQTRQVWVSSMVYGVWNECTHGNNSHIKR